MGRRVLSSPPSRTTTQCPCTARATYTKLEDRYDASVRMTGILTPETLSLFLYFVVPGIVVVKVYDLIVPSTRRDAGAAFLDALAYSFMILAGILALPAAGDGARATGRVAVLPPAVRSDAPPRVLRPRRIGNLVLPCAY